MSQVRKLCFLQSNPEVKLKFVHTDLNKQIQILQHSINYVIMFARGEKIAQSAIGRIRKSHARSGMNITPALYAHWKESFLQALSEVDPEYDSKHIAAWSSVLQKAIDYIVSGYNE